MEFLLKLIAEDEKEQFEVEVANRSVDVMQIVDNRALLTYVVQKRGWGKVLQNILKGRPDLDLNFIDSRGMTLLSYAAMKGDEEIVGTLIEHGSEFDKDPNKETNPIKLAARYKNWDIHKMLKPNDDE